MNANDISKELQVIADNFELGHYDVVVQKSLVLIEKKLREVIKRDFTQLEISVQIKVNAYLAEKKKAIDNLTMGEIIGLLRGTEFLEAWKQRFNKDLRILETIKLNELVELRNEVAHGTRSEFTREEATFVRNYQSVVLQSFELKNEPKPAKELPEKPSKVTSRTLLRFKVLFLLIGIVATPVLLASLVALYLPTLILPTPSPSPSPNIAPSWLRFNCGSVTTIPQAECETLVSFYHSTGGSDWKDKTGWSKTNEPCKWYGVICESGNVSRIILEENNLVGKIPDLSQLTQLRELLLSNNQLIGSIPNLSRLTQLKGLWLFNNQLIGSIPDLSQSKELQTLRLFNNQLSGSIPDLSQLKELQELYLSNNQLSGSIPDLSQLKELQTLWLFNNQLSGSIPDLSKLKNLATLRILNNQLCSNPNIQYPEKWQEQVNQYPHCSSK
jgi:Leucine Rich repeats (2 copies)